jgi:hypothetical protein
LRLNSSTGSEAVIAAARHHQGSELEAQAGDRKGNLIGFTDVEISFLDQVRMDYNSRNVARTSEHLHPYYATLRPSLARPGNLPVARFY